VNEAGGSLHIAWLGPVPVEGPGVPGVATELVAGLADLGHRIECFFPAAPSELPDRLRNNPNLEFVWSHTRWQWNRWYSRNALMAFVTGLGARARAFIRLRGAIRQRHTNDPFDLIYQFSNIETLGVPRGLARKIPLVIHPETHIAGELRWLHAERPLGRRCQPWYRLLLVKAIFAVRSAVQRVTIKQASLLICISSVFRDHLVSDYRFPREATVVVPNPVKLERFDGIREGLGQPPTILVIGRIALRKGVDQIVALSHLLKRRGIDVHIKVIGGHSLWSDYRPLLRDLEPTNATYVGHVAGDNIPDELRHADMLIQASKYEPFGLTVAEALAAGVPVVATSEVGAIEGTTRLAAIAVPIEDPISLGDAVQTMLERLGTDVHGVRRTAREDAQRLFSADVVCRQISEALRSLVASNQHDGDTHREHNARRSRLKTTAVSRRLFRGLRVSYED
jgi:glycosyltransferase involved in cell wall biosynthesis